MKLCVIFLLILQLWHVPISEASTTITGGIYSKVSDWIHGEDESSSQGSIKNTLTIVEISSMRVRDIRRRLSRQHGYGADEIAVMLDKKELINALAFEEHKAMQKERDRKKRVAFRRSIIVALLCVIFVMFKDLFVHAFEVASVNFVVYTDKKKYEWSRCRELKSVKGLFGLFLTIIVNMLQFWLSASVLLSWVMRSKYFFPIPHIPIRPAALLTTASGGTGGSGPFDHYGLNVGPMIVSALFRFVNGRIELFMGKALAEAHKREKKVKKAARKEEERKEAEREAEILRQERRAARTARRAERERRRKAAEASAAASGSELGVEKETDTGNDRMNTEKETIHQTSETEHKEENVVHSNNDSSHEVPGGMDELD